MLSFTYAFIPWITATTATRNATLTMTPSSVKNERSLLARIWMIAVARTSPNRIRRVRGGAEASSNPHGGLGRAQAPDRPGRKDRLRPTGRPVLGIQSMRNAPVGPPAHGRGEYGGDVQRGEANRCRGRRIRR